MNISVETIHLSRHFRAIALRELVPRHFHRQMGKISQHSDGSFVTEADLASERLLVAAAKQTHPHAIATGEEAIAEDPRYFLKSAKNKDVLIFDPLEGTGAFLKGLPMYGIQGAYIRSGITMAGIIYTPGLAHQNEDGSLTPQTDMTIIAERGKGCWMIKGANFKNPLRLRIEVRPVSLSGAARVAFACRNQDEKYQSILTNGLSSVVDRYHAHHDYIRILLNETDATFYAEGFMPNGVGKCPPWDHAAGVLMIQEAGGYAALPYGEVGKGGHPYDPLQCHSSLLVAANSQLFKKLHEHIHAYTPELCQPR